MKLRAARDDDRDAIIALLDAESLPTSDLWNRALEDFIVAENEGSVVGCIGAEVLGGTALLRSLAVGVTSRRQGLAGRLIESLEFKLLEHGVVDSWLLTIDASDFFLRHGYWVQSREDVPDAIRRTDEFSSLCPGTAIVMSKPLA
ncbi:MAG: arsenic resistance N-acetyltransferase ArsN2 [Woeseiaceae bacterium]|nr:arsenic resistance N-acetyltransferase ArsN2 [Woeseiaceae bacterium]